MNERIRELADRAGEYADFESGLCTDEFLEKFAELIVRECIRSVEDVVSGRACVDYDWIVKQTKRTAIEKIKLKFGVEE